MSIWVRSQDKEFLMKVDNINLELNRLFTFVGGVTTAFTLGTYKSKERALEVLDDIQRYLIPSIDMIGKIPEDGKIYGVNSIVSMVYQMPKE